MEVVVWTLKKTPDMGISTIRKSQNCNEVFNKSRNYLTKQG